MPLPPAKYTTLDQRNRFAQELLERVAALPGVDAATFGLPFGGPQTPFQSSVGRGDNSKRIRSIWRAPIICARSASRCAAAACSTLPRSGAAIALP